MQTPAYRETRRKNGIRITQSDSWKAAVREYKESGRAKAACVKRKMPKLPNWVQYVSPGGRKHKFRSSWEETLAMCFDHLGLQWKFEPQRFILPDGTSYLPDFKVETPWGSCFVEAHRIRKVVPGDEAKVKLLKQISFDGLLPHPLILIGGKEIGAIRNFLGLPRRKKRRRTSSSATRSWASTLLKG